jgi:CubicO group peptidase (beta-lactamase class C family)
MSVRSAYFGEVKDCSPLGVFATIAFVAAVAPACKSNDTSSSRSPSTDAGLTDAAAIADGAADAAPLVFDWTALDAEEFGGSWQTEGLVVMVGGQVVHEKYGAGWTATMPHILYSATKSIGSALVGIAINDGLMQKTDSICKYVSPDAGAPGLCSVTIEDLLHMSSGFGWVEDYSGNDPTQSNVLEMLYGNQASMGAYTASQAIVADAGALFNYSSGDANLISLAFTTALGGQDPRAYAQSKLFGPAGITSALCEEDRSGSIVISTDCFMTPRDFAKFGQLYLDNGMSGTTQVLPVGWVAYTVTPASSVATPTSRVDDAGPGPGGSYGAEWWLNSASPTATSDTWEYPDEPVDGFNAEGHYGQKLIVIPSRQLVIARTGADLVTTYDPDPMIGAAVAAVDKATGKGAQ